MKTKIELHPAHVWDCDECGRENFCRSVAVELNPDDPADAEMIAIAEEESQGMINSVHGFWQTAPDEVVCHHCGAEFETIDSRNETGEDNA